MVDNFKIQFYIYVYKKNTKVFFINIYLSKTLLDKFYKLKWLKDYKKLVMIKNFIQLLLQIWSIFITFKNILNYRYQLFKFNTFIIVNSHLFIVNFDIKLNKHDFFYKDQDRSTSMVVERMARLKASHSQSSFDSDKMLVVN